jgi:hypothetical protein
MGSKLKYPLLQSNYVMGPEPLEVGRPAVYLIDFGLARRYNTPAGNLREVRARWRARA